MSEESGRGELYRPDETLWGEVEYSLLIQAPSGARLGSMSGRLRPIPPAQQSAPFFDFVGPNKYGALKLKDGRWLLVVLQSNGDLLPYGQIRPAGPQPKP